MPQLIVALNGLHVGALTLDRSGGMEFQYNAEWLDRPGARAISLSLPLSRSPYRGELVYNFFDNLLPDSDAIRARMQARFKIPSRHPFDLLSTIGRDCVGAIQLFPGNASIPDVRAVTAEPLDTQTIANLLKGYRDAPLGMTGEQNFPGRSTRENSPTVAQQPVAAPCRQHTDKSHLQASHRVPRPQQHRPSGKRRE